MLQLYERLVIYLHFPNILLIKQKLQNLLFSTSNTVNHAIHFGPTLQQTIKPKNHKQPIRLQIDGLVAVARTHYKIKKGSRLPLQLFLRSLRRSRFSTFHLLHRRFRQFLFNRRLLFHNFNFRLRDFNIFWGLRRFFLCNYIGFWDLGRA